MKRGTDEMEIRSDEVGRFAERASALLAALFLLTALLFSQLLDPEQRDAASGLYGPAVKGLLAADMPAEPQASERAEDPGVAVRLADVDPDVAPEVTARLIAITAEVLDKSTGIELKGEGPKILIYHTHDTEAYTQTDRYTYTPSGDWRTKDQTRSVVAVGEELARLLRDVYGISVIHDTTCHEPPLITTAYSRSLETMLSYKKRYPSLEMFIDLHRDGVSATGYEDDYVTIDGKQAARLMFVVGTGRKNAGADPLPDFESNYALAAALTQQLLSYNDRFTRNIRVKSGGYNQQVSNKCILVEVGHNANTLEQALAAMPYLAAAIAEVAGVAQAGAIDLTPAR